MKLSEAIIKGCEGTRKLRFSMWNGSACCALGAACLGAGIAPGNDIGPTMTRKFPVLDRLARHPETGGTYSVAIITVDLNDCWSWPRLSIAEWIANVVEPEFYK